MKASWDLTQRCNLNCKHCGAANYISKRHELEEKDLLKIVDNMSGMITLVDLLGGEPLVCKGIEALLIKLEKSEIDYNIITNGQHEKEKTRSLLKNKKRLKTLLISLEGMQKENDMIRGEGSFDKAISFIEEIKEIKKENKLQCEIKINITMNKLNKDNIEKMISYFIEVEKVDGIQFVPMRKEGNAQVNDYLILTDAELLKYYEKIAKYIMKNNYEKMVGMDYSVLKIPEYLDAKYGMTLNIFGKKCNAGESEIYINAIGEASPCRECNNMLIDLKKESLRSNYNRFNEFMLKKTIKENFKSECNCVYNDICNECIYIKRQSEEKICQLISSKLENTRMFNEICFISNDDAIFLEDMTRDFFAVYYLSLNERIEYEQVGFIILKLIRDKALSAETISDIIGIDKEIIFQFLVQEQSKSHVKQVVEGDNNEKIFVQK